MKQLRGTGLKDFLKHSAECPSISLVFALQDVEDPVIVGSAFRIADACGADTTQLLGDTQST